MQKNVLRIFAFVAVLVLPSVLVSCIDIIRGNKSITYIDRTIDSQILMYTATEATVQADKAYEDTGKVDLPLLK